MFIFVKEGIRKLSDLNTVRGNNTQFILIRWHLVAKTSSFEQELVPQTRKERVECGQVWHLVAVSRVRYCITDRKE